MTTGHRRVQVIHLAPGRFPDHQGTPLAIRWLAEAQLLRGFDVEIWTGDAGSRRRPSRGPNLPVARHGWVRASASSGPSLRRVLGAASLVPPLRRCRARAIFHAHGPDAAWLCRAAAAPAWVGQRHSDMVREMPSYWPAAPRAARWAGHVLDHGFRGASQRVSFVGHSADEGNAGQTLSVEPVVPDYEIEHVTRFRRPPSTDPFVVYLGNGDRYQNLELLFFRRWESAVRRRWVYHPPLDPDLARAARAAGFELVAAHSLEQTLEAAAGAWWGLCPRRLAAGYPYKLLNYALLGMPVLSSLPWPGPVPVLTVQDWGAPLPGLSEPPPSPELHAIRRARERTLDALETVYASLSQLLPNPH